MKRALLLLLLGTSVAACGSSSLSPTATPTPLVAAPEPAVSPPLTATPAGTVIDLKAVDPEGVVDYGGTVAVATRKPEALVLLDAATLSITRSVPVPGSARHLELRGNDVLVPGEDTDLLTTVSLPAGSIASEVKVGRQPHDVAPVGDTEVVADEFGNAVTAVTVGSGATTTLAGPLQPGGIAASGGRVGAVAVRGRLLYVYDPAPLRLVATVPVGAGPTHAIDVGGGVLAVADTTGGAIYLVRVTGKPAVLAVVPLSGRPYGMAVDAERELLYVATGADNLVHAFTVKPGGTGLVAGRTYPSVRQPNSLAVDPLSHAVIVAGATPEGSLQSFKP